VRSVHFPPMERAPENDPPRVPRQLIKAHTNGNGHPSGRNGTLSPLEVTEIEEAEQHSSVQSTTRSEPESAQNVQQTIYSGIQADPLEALNLVAKVQSESRLISRTVAGILSGGSDNRHGSFIVARGAAIRLQAHLTRLIALEEQ
jgi:hypothetical protein